MRVLWLAGLLLFQTPSTEIRISRKSLPSTDAVIVFERELPGTVGLCIPGDDGKGLVCSSLDAFRRQAATKTNAPKK